MRKVTSVVTVALLVALSAVSARHVSARREEPRSGEREMESEGEREIGSGRGEGSGEAGPCRESFVLRMKLCAAQPKAVAAAVAAEPMAFRRVLVGTGGDTETSITSARDGWMLACSHGGFEGQSSVWASRDRGRTWKRTVPKPNPLVSGDCDVAVMDDGTWAVVFDTIASATVATSRDHGKRWSVNALTALPVGGVDRPWIVSMGGRLLLAYGDVQANEPAVQFVQFSDDRGRSWSLPKIVHTFDAPDRINGIMGRPVVTGRTIRIPIVGVNIVSGLGPSWLSLVVSRDGGRTWSSTPVLGPYASGVHFTTLTRAPNGTLFMGLPTGAIGDLDVSVLTSMNDGRTWKRIVLAHHVAIAGGGAVDSVSVDARPDGTATVAWLAATAHGRQVWAARVDAKRVVSSARGISAPVADESSFEFIMAGHDSSGRAHIVAPLDTGPACHGPSISGGRLRQCVYDFVER